MGDHSRGFCLGPFVSAEPRTHRRLVHGRRARGGSNPGHRTGSTGLPESDSFFRYLFALGSGRDTGLKRLWIVNPDESGEVAARVEAMVGRGAWKRLRFLRGNDGRFENAIFVIQKELETELQRRCWLARCYDDGRVDGVKPLRGGSYDGR